LTPVDVKPRVPKSSSPASSSFARRAAMRSSALMPP